jgi:hypothetical protein
MAESELSVLSCQCLSRRIADKDTLTKHVDAWQRDRMAERPHGRETATKSTPRQIGNSPPPTPASN